MSSKDYNVRLYMPRDEEAIVELLKTSYPEWKDAGLHLITGSGSILRIPMDLSP